ncbi:MAG TPA: hypothetical protein PK504_02510 [Ferruginibacter sp.]|nr:hypothetical protein [Ferruginibacter sp.]HRE63262.1 hypothetical protein [Ferruginibacter sp.]
MKKAIIFTALSWAIALSGYAQTLRMPLPKGLHCNDLPTWPITHTKKGSTDNATTNKSYTYATASSSTPGKSVSTLLPLPFIKFWLATEASDSKTVE